MALETEKDRKLTEWAKKAYSEYRSRVVTYDDYCDYGLEKSFIEALREREQYFIDSYFKEPEGTKLMSPNMNEDGFVGLEDRIKTQRLFCNQLWEALKKHPEIKLV